ncbi:branched-chain amino acid ABC transporter permease [Longispora fulva]|uniref:Branched-chain amino acid transport system permease protein n=1 Tax=Longispora fulva TaxID=619741 RepID=A0A8J7G8S3_9ACTN|nr:branched-chain amino acid ABC transporter permease [Longispora fulva]MBG6135798.1 branched-chain amino acid transport system permease protein [Longispora fulva]GIG55960.1 branched-chain amino acid ABC transporter permease [Longispora fulva]
MRDLILIALTGLGLGALYYLVAAGLSLIFGLMDVLNFAHGAFLAAGAYGTWWATGHLPGGGTQGWGFVLSVVFGVALGAILGALTELTLIRPLYARPIRQVLVTVGLSLAATALLRAVAGADPLRFPKPGWTARTTRVVGATVPNDRLLLIGAAVTVFAALSLFLRTTRYGLIVRAGVQDRAMVTALGIDVRRAFTLVFAIGGGAAALAGALGGVYFESINPAQGGSLLIFAFIVVVIGRMGSVTGTAVAAVAVGLVQQFANFYAASGLGDLSVVLLLAAVLLTRRATLTGSLA